MGKLICDEITFRKLEIFLAYMSHSNLTKAAEQLDISPVSVHRALHSLEEGVGCALFHHTGRNLIPTEAARVLANAASDVQERMSNGIKATREAAGLYADRLRIGTVYSLTAQLVPRVVVDLKARRPNLSTDLALGSNADLTEKLKQGQIDAALMPITDHDPELECIDIFKDSIYFAAPAGSIYAARESIGLDEVKNELFVSLSGGFATTKGFQEAFKRAGFTPHIFMEVSDIFTLMNLVRGGLGYALLPGRVKNMFGDHIQFIPLTENFQIHQSVGLIFLRARERDPNILALAAACRMIGKHEF